MSMEQKSKSIMMIVMVAVIFIALGVIVIWNLGGINLFSQREHLYGNVDLQSGNCMPTPVGQGETRKSDCLTKPVMARIIIYDYVSEDETSGLGSSMYQTISGLSGNYRLSVPQGLYTVVARPLFNPFVSKIQITLQKDGQDQEQNFRFSNALY